MNKDIPILSRQGPTENNQTVFNIYIVKRINLRQQY